MNAPADQAAIDATLNERARRLAELPRPADGARTLEVVVCRLGAEEFAIELRLLRGRACCRPSDAAPHGRAFCGRIAEPSGRDPDRARSYGDALTCLGFDGREVLIAETERVRVGLLVG